MDKDKVIAGLKKNMVSVICGVVALVAVIAAFYPVGGMNEQLKADADARAQKHGALTALLTKDRNLPLMDVGTGGTPATPAKLVGFPNPEVINQGKAAIDGLSAEATALMGKLQEAGGAADHRPLVNNVLPMPASDFPKVDYREVYKLVLSLDPYVSGNGKGVVPNPVQPDTTSPKAVTSNEKLVAAGALNLCNDVLHATQPPSAELIKDRISFVGENVYGVQVVTKDGVATNGSEINAAFEKAKRQIPDQLKVQAARNRLVYLDEGAFQVSAEVTGGPGGGTGTVPAMTAIWFSQVQLWVQQDVARAVAEVNATSHNVTESPVKRVVKLQLNPDLTMYAVPPAGQNANGAGPTGPVPAAETETGKLPVEYRVSPTGRASNGMYDVIPFRLVIDVDASQVNRVIQTLQSNRLVTIYDEDVRTINSADFFEAGYVYGPAPVVRLTLTGEDLLLRTWELPLMPHDIKILLGLEKGLLPGGVAGPGGGMTSPQMGTGGGLRLGGGG